MRELTIAAVASEELTPPGLPEVPPPPPPPAPALDEDEAAAACCCCCCWPPGPGVEEAEPGVAAPPPEVPLAPPGFILGGTFVHEFKLLKEFLYAVRLSWLF